MSSAPLDSRFAKRELPSLKPAVAAFSPVADDGRTTPCASGQGSIIGRFLWLKRVKDCPKSAVGFDFDGAEFTHVDSKVTFEVLLSSFNLERDPGLRRLGALVHHLDVGGIPIAEGPGFATIMAGARALQDDDDELLKAMTPVLDSLYVGYAGANREG